MSTTDANLPANTFGPFLDMHGRLWPPSQGSAIVCG